MLKNYIRQVYKANINQIFWSIFLSPFLGWFLNIYSLSKHNLKIDDELIHYKHENF